MGKVRRDGGVKNCGGRCEKVCWGVGIDDTLQVVM